MSCCPTCGQAVPPSGLLVSLDTNEVSRNGECISLRPQEIEVLHMLATKAPLPVSKAYLMDGVYGALGGPEDEDNLLRVIIFRLRRKLASLCVGIETIHSKGYRLHVHDLGHLNA